MVESETTLLVAAFFVFDFHRRERKKGSPINDDGFSSRIIPFLAFFVRVVWLATVAAAAECASYTLLMCFQHQYPAAKGSKNETVVTDGVYIGIAAVLSLQMVASRVSCHGRQVVVGKSFQDNRSCFLFPAVHGLPSHWTILPEDMHAINAANQPVNTMLEEVHQTYFFSVFAAHWAHEPML
jgi:hypothetical protein